MKRKGAQGVEFASAMASLLQDMTLVEAAQQGRSRAELVERDSHQAQRRLEVCVDKTAVALVSEVSRGMNAAQSAAFFSYVIAKTIGFERAFAKNRNPVRERKQIKLLVQIFREGLEEMIDRIEIETKRAIKSGAIDLDEVKAAYEEQKGSAEKEAEHEEGTHEAKLVKLPK